MKPGIKAVYVGAIALLALPAWAEDIEMTRSVAGDATIEVFNVAGRISITAWDQDEVRLRGSIGRNQEVVVHESSSGIRFEVKNKNGQDDYDEAKLQLDVPVGASLVAEGVSADVSISGSRGASVMAESVSGDVEVSAEVDRVELSSVSGDIEFAGRASRGSFESVSGDIGASGVSGEVGMSTVSGDGRLEAGVLDRARFETVSGNLKLALTLAPGGRLTAEAMSGDVTLTVPTDQEGEFDVETFSGDIRSVFGSAEDASFGPGSRLKHVAGSSGALFRIENFSGDVRIEH
jgi:DUF4097 and DUF4098 domain-containing protein YvlB